MYLQYNEYNSISRKNSRKKIEWWIEKHHNNQNSVQFSCSVVSDSLWPQGLQQARPPCPSPTPSVYSNSCPLSWWCHPTISFSIVPLSCPQSLPASKSFPMSQLFSWGGQNIGVSAFSISTSKEHPGLISFRMDWLDLLAVQGTLKSLLQHHSSLGWKKNKLESRLIRVRW